MKNNRSFTLIEMISVVAVISLIAAIVLVNSKDVKKSAVTSFVETNRSIFQQAADLYYLDHETYPTVNQLELDLYNPQFLDTDLLIKEGYIKKDINLKQVKEQYYWIDVFGTVWGATKPTVKDNLLLKHSNDLTYTYNVTLSDEYEAVNIYKVNGDGLETVASAKMKNLTANSKGTLAGKDGVKISYRKVTDVTVADGSSFVFDLQDTNGDYLVSAIDEYQLETVPVGAGYDPEGFKPIRGGNGEFDYILESNSMKYWTEFVTLQNTPGESKIDYKFSVKEKINGEYGEWFTKFDDVPDGYGIKVNIKMARDEEGNKPDLLFLKVLYTLNIKEKPIKNVVYPEVEEIPSVQSQGELVIKSSNGGYSEEDINSGGNDSYDKELYCPVSSPSSSIIGGYYYLTYNMYLASGQGVESISTPNLTDETRKMESVTISYSHKGKPYVTADDLFEIPSESCISIVYKFQTEGVNGNPNIIEYPSPPHVVVKDKIYLSSPTRISLSDNPTTAGIPNKPNPKDEELLDENWITIDDIRFFQHGINVSTVWHGYESEETFVEDKSRIVYRFANGEGFYWGNEVDEFPEGSSSNALLVHAYLQVHKDHYDDVNLADPAVKWLKIFSSDYPEGKLIEMDKPSLLIYPQKDNNLDRATISTSSNVEWKTVAVDPSGLKIIKTEWRGQIQNKYEKAGKYYVEARVQNDHKSWSNWTTYSFEVFAEKPIADFQVDNHTGFAYLNEKTEFDTSLSKDPDGDKIVDYQWSNKKDVYTKEGYEAVTLRVKDSEGNWSNPTTKQIRVLDKDKDFWLFNGKAPSELKLESGFDTADDSYAQFKTGKVTWLKNIEGKTIRILLDTTYKNNYDTLPITAEFKDKNGKVLPTLNTKVGTPITEMTAVRSLTEYFVRVPEGAVSLEFRNYSNYYGDSEALLYDLRVVEENLTVKPITKVSVDPTFSSLEFKWEKEENIEKVFFYQDGQLVGTSTGLTHKFGPLNPDTKYTYTVRSMAKNVLSKAIEVSGQTDETFVVFSGTQPAAFDKNPSTAVTFNTAKITWNRDLTDYTVKLRFDTTFRSNYAQAPAYAYVKDKNGNTLSFYTTTGTVVNQVVATAGVQEFLIKMPANAAYIEFKNSSAGSYGTGQVVLYSVEVVNELGTVASPKNVSYTSTEYDVTINWEKESGVEKTFFYKDGVQYSSSTGTSIKFSPLVSGSTHTFEMRTLKAGLLSDPEFITVKLKEAYVSFVGAGPAAFDKNDTSAVTFNTAKVTWNRDLTDHMVRLVFDTTFRSNYSQAPAYAYVKDKDGKTLSVYTTTGSVLSTITAINSKQTYIFKMPAGAEYIEFVNSSAGYYGSGQVVLYSLEVINETKQADPVSNVSYTSGDYNVSLQWDVPTGTEKTFIYENGTAYKNTTGTTINFTPLVSGSTHKYELRTLKGGILSDPVFITAKVKEADVIFSGVGPAAFDKNPTSSVTFSTGSVTWNKDISGQTMFIRMESTFKSNYSTSPVHATFKDANGKELSSINTNGQILPRITSTRDVVQYYVRVPEGAVKLDFTTQRGSEGTSNVNLYSIEVVNLNHTLESPSKVDYSAEQTTVTITWENETEGVTTYIYRNGSLVGNSKTGSYNMTGLTAGTTYNVELVNFINNKYSEKKKLTLTTKASE